MSATVSQDRAQDPRLRTFHQIFLALRSSPLGFIAALVLVAHLCVTLAAPLIAPYSPTAFVGDALDAPSLTHLLGTDQLGRDVLSRALYGGRTALSTAIPAAALGVLLAAALGVLAALSGGWIDWAINRIVESFLAIPSIMILLIAVAGFGSSWTAMTVSLALIYGVPSLRVTRAAARQIVRNDFVLAARARGERTTWVVVNEVLPNVRDVVLVEFALRTSSAVMLVSALSFLGLGVNPPTPDWGLMLSENRTYLSFAWWPALGAIVPLGTLVLALTIFSDSLAKALGIDRRRTSVR